MKRQRDFEPMDVYFSVFNLHCNNAGDRAKRAFIKKFGKKVWDETIAVAHKNGIMTIFHTKPTEHTKWYAEKVQEFVNDGRPVAVVQKADAS